MAQEMIEAVKAGDLPRVRELLEQDPSLAGVRTDEGYSAVTFAAYFGRDDIVDLLLRHGASLDVFEAAIVGDVNRLVERLDAEPVLVHAFSHDGWTPLHLAAHFGRTKAVQYLLVQGADPNAVSKNETATVPVISAAAGRSAGKLAAIEALLAGGADVNGTDPHGHTALHVAAMDGQLELAELLLDRGAAVNARTKERKTPLAMAREAGKSNVVSFLEQRGGAE
jgi:ankyrin repeat protein